MSMFLDFAPPPSLRSFMESVGVAAGTPQRGSFVVQTARRRNGLLPLTRVPFASFGTEGGAQESLLLPPVGC
jgi:hypothetical protein